MLCKIGNRDRQDRQSKTYAIRIKIHMRNIFKQHFRWGYICMAYNGSVVEPLLTRRESIGKSQLQQQRIINGPECFFFVFLASNVLYSPNCQGYEQRT